MSLTSDQSNNKVIIEVVFDQYFENWKVQYWLGDFDEIKSIETFNSQRDAVTNALVDVWVSENGGKKPVLRVHERNGDLVSYPLLTSWQEIAKDLYYERVYT